MGVSVIIRSLQEPVGRRRAVLRALCASRVPMSIAAIAGKLGVHPNTVRFHLDNLVADGQVERVEPGRGDVRVTDAADTGLSDASADVVIGEAMLTMQGNAAKHTIVAEAARVLRPGGRYAIHELALVPDDVAEQVRTDLRQSLARALKVNARPLTVAEWSHLLAGHGLVVEHVVTASMALLQPRRVIADEGLLGALRFAGNLLIHRAARRRVLLMRHTFRRHRERLTAVAIVAHKPHVDS